MMMSDDDYDVRMTNNVITVFFSFLHFSGKAPITRGAVSAQKCQERFRSQKRTFAQSSEGSSKQGYAAQS